MRGERERGDDTESDGRRGDWALGRRPSGLRGDCERDEMLRAAGAQVCEGMGERKGIRFLAFCLRCGLLLIVGGRKERGLLAVRDGHSPSQSVSQANWALAVPVHVSVHKAASSANRAPPPAHELVVSASAPRPRVSFSTPVQNALCAAFRIAVPALDRSAAINTVVLSCQHRVFLLNVLTPAAQASEHGHTETPNRPLLHGPPHGHLHCYLAL